MSDFSGKVILVTGARGGLGSVVTHAFLNAGAAVVGTSRSIAEAEFAHPRFLGIAADLADGAAAIQLADAVMRKHGRLDALIHVAGGFDGGSPIHQTGDATWDSMMNLNARGAFHILRAVIPHMRKAGEGRIVAIGSRAGVEPAANIAAYSASKAALVSLMRTAALENRDAGITANVILPGTIDTEANRKSDPKADFSRWVSPQRISEVAMMLVSDAGAQITGAAIPVYGFQ